MGQHPAGRASISGLAKFRSELTLPGVFVDKSEGDDSHRKRERGQKIASIDW